MACLPPLGIDAPLVRARDADYTSGRRNDRDPVASIGPEPEVPANLDRGRVARERRVVRPGQEVAHGERPRVDLHDAGATVARVGDLAGREQRAVAREVDVVDAKPERDLVALRRRRAAREANERLAAPRGEVERLAVGGELDAVRASGLAARDLLPAARGVPLPELAVLLAGHHLLQRGLPAAARQPVGRDEAAVRQAADRVQTDRLGRDHAADPREARRREAQTLNTSIDSRAPCPTAMNWSTGPTPASTYRPCVVKASVAFGGPGHSGYVFA